MILNWVLLCLLIIVLTVLICVFLILFSPKESKDVHFTDPDCVISDDERNYITPDVPLVKLSDKKAFVMCACHKEFKVDRSIFNRQHTCFMINSDNGTGTDCKYSCIGLGDCVKVCPQQAIRIINNTAVVTSLCIGCGKCIDVCPLHIIKLVPINSEKIIPCSNCNNDPTSCSAIQKENKLEWQQKKDFKIWNFCYRIIKKIGKK